MPEPFSIQTLSDKGAFAKVVFEKQSDRWSHRIEWVTPLKSILIASSIEGSPDCDWPPSQPLQEISQVELEGFPVLLGVGMAGRSHWSVSCSLEPESSERGGAFFFDLACLAKTMPPGWLGSSYQLGPAVTIGNCSENRVTLKIGSDCEIVFSARNSQQQDRGWSTRFLIVGDQLQIKPAAMSTSSTTATRWDFAVQIVKKPMQSE